MLDAEIITDSEETIMIQLLWFMRLVGQKCFKTLALVVKGNPESEETI